MSARPNAAHFPHEMMLSGPLPAALWHAGGSRIECLAGCALITAYDTAADIELQRGDSFIVPNDGLVLLEGVQACRLRIRPVRPTSRKPASALPGFLVSRIGSIVARVGTMRLLARLPSGRRSSRVNVSNT